MNETYVVDFSYNVSRSDAYWDCGGYRFWANCPICEKGSIGYFNVFHCLPVDTVVRCNKCKQHFKIKDDSSCRHHKSTTIKSVEWIDDGIQKRWSDEPINYKNKMIMYQYDVKLKRLDEKEYQDAICVIKILLKNVYCNIKVKGGYGNWYSVIKKMCGDKSYVLDKLVELNILNYIEYQHKYPDSYYADLYIPDTYAKWMKDVVSDYDKEHPEPELKPEKEKVVKKETIVVKNIKGKSVGFNKIELDKSVLDMGLLIAKDIDKKIWDECFNDQIMVVTLNDKTYILNPEYMKLKMIEPIFDINFKKQ